MHTGDDHVVRRGEAGDGDVVRHGEADGGATLCWRAREKHTRGQ
jgi:hypothetical protein